jgi:hypothetical protein
MVTAQLLMSNLTISRKTLIYFKVMRLFSYSKKYNCEKKRPTFMRSKFFGPSGPAWSSHMNLIRRVLPHPVSPMMITGMPQLNEALKTNYPIIVYYLQYV